MKKILIPLTLLISTGFMSSAQNPFFEDFKGAHETAPFSQIKNEHWMPAIDRGIELAQQEVNAITSQRSTPDFDNTVVALERVGADLNRVLNVFFYGDLPLHYQKTIFDELECTKRMGLTLTDSLLMYPTKSVSAFIGLTANPQSCHIGKCKTCDNVQCEFREQ